MNATATINQPASKTLKPMAILDQAIERNAHSLKIPKEELVLWLDQQMAPLYTQLQLLRLADKYQLDPLSNEVGIFQHDDSSQAAYITIDGWAKLINQHPQYAGMSLRESTELTEGIPNWMECTIYRNDRILPIVIKEYFQEVKGQHPSWHQMPRRMLRHRVIQQCARLALGISEADFNQKNAQELPPEIGADEPKKSQNEKLKALLKTKQAL